MKELLRYALNGGATTAVNYGVYLLLLSFEWNYLGANTVAWGVAVLFAYATNRLFVFRSKNAIGKELLSFVSMRFLTLLLENFLLFVCIQLLLISPFISKLAISAVTVLGNFLICKCRIFQKGVTLHE